jgi:hypothetical protein
MQTESSATPADVERLRRASLRVLTEAIVLAFRLGRTDLDPTLTRLRTRFFMASATREDYGAVLGEALTVLRALESQTMTAPRDDRRSAEEGRDS